MKSKTHPAAIGIFIVGAMVIAFVSLALFGSGRFFHKTRDMLLTFREPVTGLDVGAPVKLLGVAVGSVKQINISVSEVLTNELLVNVIVTIDLESAQSSFQGEELNLDDREHFNKVISQLGLKGQLDMLSMLSGQLYIALDMFPGEVGFQLNEKGEGGLWEIPTLPSTKRQVMQSIVTSLGNLAKFDVKGTSEQLHGLLTDMRRDLAALQLKNVGTNLAETVAAMREVFSDRELRSAITNMNQTLVQINRLATNLDGRIDPLMSRLDEDLQKAGDMFDEATKAMQHMQTQLDPNAPLSRELVRTLDEASTTLSAIRQLAEQLERNPSSLISGKKETSP